MKEIVLNTCICRRHTLRFHEAFDDRGIGHLAVKSDEEAAALAKSYADGDPKFDALLLANQMLTVACLKYGSPEDLVVPAGEQACPLCVAVRHGADEDSWINGVADAILARARQLGLAPTLQ